jgi:hypothetical protein
MYFLLTVIYLIAALVIIYARIVVTYKLEVEIWIGLDSVSKQHILVLNTTLLSVFLI